MNTDLMFSAKSDDWSTPTDVYNELNKEFMFSYDPCPLQSEDKHALFIDWGMGGEAVFVNPPYSNIGNFMDKALLELQRGNCSVVVFLVPSRTDTRWWHDYVLKRKAEVRFIRGRLKFGDAVNSAPFPSSIIVFRSTDNSSYRNVSLKEVSK